MGRGKRITNQVRGRNNPLENGIFEPTLHIKKTGGHVPPDYTGKAVWDIEDTNRPIGTQVWYRDGVIHRDVDLPAIIYPNGCQEWRHRGYAHRFNGPALIYPSGDDISLSDSEEYYLSGKQTSKQHVDLVNSYLRSRGENVITLLTEEFSPEDFSGKVIYPGGWCEWYQDGLLHREEDLPAKIEFDGSLRWFRQGKLHRLEGPAIITPKGRHYWYQDGNPYREDDLPTITVPPSAKYWTNKKGEHHRLTGPAIIDNDGTEEYCLDGIIFKNRKAWSLELKRREDEKEIMRLVKISTDRRPRPRRSPLS